MITSAFLLVAYGVFGASLVVRSAGRDPAPGGAWELVIRSAIAGAAAWTTVSWLLALAHLFVPATIAACALAAAAFEGVRLARHLRRARTEAPEPRVVSGWTLAVILPVLLWLVYASWRSFYVPVENHDAIAYHLPRAVLFFLDHGYRFHAEISDARLATWPADYELMLGSILTLGHSDQGTVLLSLAGYLGCGAVGAAACTRWWGRSHASLVVFAVVLATPLVLLHSGAHKNDLLFAFFAACASYWLVPWALTADLPSALFGIAALGLAIGTKVHGSLLGAFAAPLLIMGAVKLRPRARLAPLAAYGLACALLLGGIELVLNVIHTGGLALSTRTFQNASGSMYGEWGNLWKFPAAMLTAPFTSRTTAGLWVPWSSERYWWSPYDLNFGDFGVLFTVSLVLAPIVEWRRGRDARSLERVLCVALVLVTFASLLPLRVRPFGFFFQEARYYLAVVPFVIAWGAGGALDLLARSSLRPPTIAAISSASLVVSGTWLACNAYGAAIDDSFQPFSFVAAAATAETPPHIPPAQLYHRRIGYLVDDAVPPRDVVAVDLGYDTWLYPMFGKDYARPLRILAPSPGPVAIPAEANWVAIDRGHQEIVFGAPELTDLRVSMQQKYFGRGAPSADSTKLLKQLNGDPAFELVYYEPRTNQALFHRKPRP